MKQRVRFKTAQKMQVQTFSATTHKPVQIQSIKTKNIYNENV